MQKKRQWINAAGEMLALAIPRRLQSNLYMRVRLRYSETSTIPLGASYLWIGVDM